MTLPAWMKSRWVIVPGAIALSIAVWNIYVVSHDHGILEGRVIDAAGAPAADVTVTLFERSFVAYTAKDTVKTDAVGRFRFTNNQNHALQLEAVSPTLGKSDRLPLRLWFRGQDIRITEPLRLEGRPP